MKFIILMCVNMFQNFISKNKKTRVQVVGCLILYLIFLHAIKNENYIVTVITMVTAVNVANVTVVTMATSVTLIILLLLLLWLLWLLLLWLLLLWPLPLL
jgi:hypothetical protein